MSLLLLLSSLAQDPVDAALPEATVEQLGPDRSGPPEVLPADPLALPEPQVLTLREGVEVHYVAAPWARKTELRVVLEHGKLFLDGEQSEAARMTAWLQDTATSEHESQALSELKDLHEIELWSGSGPHDSTLSLSVPAEHAELGLELLGQVLREPAYPKADLKLAVRDRLLYYQSELPTSLGGLADAALEDAWYPVGHPYGVRPDLKALKKLRRKDLVERHARLLEQVPARVVVVSPLPWETLRPWLEEALEGVGAAGEREERFEAAPHEGTRIVAVDLPGQEQCALRLRTLAPDDMAPDRVAFAATEFALTGTFLARLNRNLREDKGWTYGVHGTYSNGPRLGVYEVSVDVPADKAGAALAELEAELALMATEGPLPSELASYAQDAVARWNRRLQTSGSAIAYYAGLSNEQRSLEQARASLEAGRSLTQAEVHAAAQRYLGAEAPRVWVIVGDRAVVEPQLAGRELTWIAAEDAALGTW